jgi:hypothetical protein
MISSSFSCPPGNIPFDDFIQYAKTRGGLKNMTPREEEYLRARFTAEGTMIEYRRFERSIIRWL